MGGGDWTFQYFAIISVVRTDKGLPSSGNIPQIFPCTQRYQIYSCRTKLRSKSQHPDRQPLGGDLTPKISTWGAKGGGQWVFAIPMRRMVPEVLGTNKWYRCTQNRILIFIKFIWRLSIPGRGNNGILLFETSGGGIELINNLYLAFYQSFFLQIQTQAKETIILTCILGGLWPTGKEIDNQYRENNQNFKTPKLYFTAEIPLVIISEEHSTIQNTSTSC